MLSHSFPCMQKERVLCVLFFALSVFFLLDSEVALTGAFLGESLSASSSLGFSILLFIAALLVVPSEKSEPLEKRIVITSTLKHAGNERLRKLAELSAKNQDAKRDMDHLIYELSKGNLNPGIHNKYLPGTDVRYARGKKGGRIFYRRIDSENQNTPRYEVIGKSNKHYENNVIDILLRKYGR